MVKGTQMMATHRKKCSISQVDRKWKLNPKENLFYTHQIGKRLSLTSSADADTDEGIPYTLWNECTLVLQHWKNDLALLTYLVTLFLDIPPK